MNRRLFLSGLVATTCLAALPVAAQTATNQVIQQLERLGYRTIDVRRTLLGRVRIIALGPLGRREIVLNPATGVILRDYTDRRDDDDEDDDPDHRNSGSGSGNGGPGNGGDDDGDDDDDDDGDDGDDGDDDGPDDDGGQGGGDDSGGGGHGDDGDGDDD